MEWFVRSHPVVRKWIRGVYRQCCDDLHPLAVKLLPVWRTVIRYTEPKIFDLLFWSDSLRFNAALYYARTRKEVDPYLQKAAKAAQRYGRILLDWLREDLRLGRKYAGILLARLNEYFQKARCYAPMVWERVLAAADFMGRRLRSSSYALRAAFQMVLLILIILMVFLRPTQAEAPDLPTPTPRALAVSQQETATPFLPPTETPIPSLTPTAEPTVIPTSAVKAETRLSGPGFCGAVRGNTGTGAFIWPTVEHALSGYDYWPRYYHFGIDIKGDRGNPIYAVDSGVVVYAGWNNTGYGNLVIIDHGHNVQSLYAHLSEILVNCGESVQQGETIAKLGSTGNSTGPHLHFEVVTGDWTHLNPWDYLKK